MHRASRLIVIASVALAGVAHGWLASWEPRLGLAALLAFVITFVLARVSLPWALAVVGGTAYLAPALLSWAFSASDYHLILVWLAAAAGPVLSRADLSRWHVPAQWTVPLVAWALVVAVTWPIIAAREVDFSAVAARTLDTTQGIFGGPPPVAAAFVAIAALAQLLGILWTDLLFARFAGAGLPTFLRFVAVPFIVSAGIGSLAGLYQGIVDITWLNPPVWSSFSRAGGLMFDANTFGTGAALWAPVAIAAAWATGRYQALGVAAFCLLTGGMWMSSSRTALLTLGAGASGVIIGALQRRGRLQPRVAAGVVLGLAAAFVITAVLVPRAFESSTPLGRAFARVPRLDDVELSRFAQELWQRFGYGAAASQIFVEHPLTGIGIGAFHVIGPDYIFRESGGYRRVGGDNAQNWWRHQIAELGLIGALPSIGLSLLLLKLLWSSHRPDETSGVPVILRMVIVGLGAASMLGVPTQHPVTFLSVGALLFFFAQAIHLREAPAPARGWWAAAAVAIVVTAVGQSITATGTLRVPHRAAALGLPYEYGLSPPEGLSDFGEMRWMKSEALAIVNTEHLWYQLTFWHPSPGAPDPVTVTVAIDGRVMLEREIRGAEPQPFFLEVPGGHRRIILELKARPAAEPHALGVARRWLRDLPEGVAADRVIR